MDRRVFVLFCLLTAVRSDDNQKKPEISFEEQNMLLKCKGGTFDDGDTIQLNYDNSGLHQCKSSLSDECSDDTCPNALVKILSSENLIELDIGAVFTVLVADVIATALIGWAIYTICAQPTTRGSYQGNKASDKQALISNHTPSGGDTYQPLNTRTDEYSTLHAQRKNKNKQSV
ncbi:T-cell surface glycoprotein CD3 delta chain-like [Sinocyclocheilus grahami]|uniref:T-cell surface glycoprotein CD3 delta chain-like n=1 Tax=Sinocyclocheilus grahami TaxID=75366 RepID=A0A672LR52_SINGR|nr:PREDICTED: T-cell surface glycoprotein CD3 delta chain-like [Sinocyclocheilus grahami]